LPSCHSGSIFPLVSTFVCACLLCPPGSSSTVRVCRPWVGSSISAPCCRHRQLSHWLSAKSVSSHRFGFINQIKTICGFVRAALCRVIGTAYVWPREKLQARVPPAETFLYASCRVPRGDGKRSMSTLSIKVYHISPRPQAGAIRLLHAKCGGVPGAALSIYLLLAVIEWIF